MLIHVAVPEVQRNWPDPQPVYADMPELLARTHFRKVRREAWSVIVTSIGYWGALTVAVSAMVWDMIGRPAAQGDLQGLPVWLKWALGIGTYAFLLGMWWRQVWPAAMFLRRERQAHQAVLQLPQSQDSRALMATQPWSDLK